MLLSFICEHYSMKKLIIYFRRLEKKNCCIPEKIGGLIIFIEEYKDTDLLTHFFIIVPRVTYKNRTGIEQS